MIVPNVKLRAEFKPLLSLISLSLEFSRCLLCKTLRVVIEPQQVTVQGKDCRRYVFELEGLTLLPDSCRSLRWASSTELQLTLQANEVTESHVSYCEGNEKNPSTNQDLLVTRIQSSQSQCHCIGCGVRIFKSNSHFNRVLPLPTENWSDFADIWFCHNHSLNGSEADSISCSGDDGSIPDHVKELKKFPMLPRVDDCLVSSLYMLVHSSHIKTGCLIPTTGRLICKRCGNFIGFVKDDKNQGSEQSSTVYKIYHHAVSFKNEEQDDSQALDASHHQNATVFSSATQQHVEDFMCCLLRDQSHLFTCFRFILSSSLQSKNQSSISVLLWLLDQDLFVFSTQSPSIQYSGESRLKASSTKYIKLLYKASFSTLGECNQSASSLTKISSIFDAWRRDNTVHGITLPYPLCKQLVHMLVSSTQTLSKSQRSLNGFHVGFLKMS